MPSPRTQATALREERARLITEARALNERAENENRGLDSVETESYDAMWDKISDLEERAKRLDLEANAIDSLDVVDSRAVDSGDRATAPRLEQRLERFRPETRDAVMRFTEKRPEIATPEYEAAWRSMILGTHGSAELRALSAGTDSEGGYTVPPVFIAQLLEKVRDNVFIEQFSTVNTLTNGDSVGRPTLENRPADADWTSELATGSEDSTLDFGSRELHPHPLAKLLKVSRKLLRASALDPASIVADNLAYKFGITREKAFLTGNGAGQPLGIFTASSNGISTSRDVSTDNTTTAMTTNGLKNAMWSLKEGYRRNARWIFHRDGIKEIDKLKDGDGNYMLQTDIRQGTGDRLFGLPVHVSEYVPSTFTTGLYVGIIGDFSHYWIANSLGFSLQRLVELYAGTNQDGFIGRMETDAMPVFEEAFARVTLA